MTVASVPARHSGGPGRASADGGAGQGRLRVVVELTAEGEQAGRVAAWLTRALSSLDLESGRLDITVRAGEETAPVIPLPRSAPERPRLYIHPPSRRVFRDGVPLGLTRLEYDLLLFLCEHPHRVHERRSLLRNVWGFAGPGRTRTLDVHVRRLRRKLGADLPLIGTVRGVGYRLERYDAVWVDDNAPA